MPTKSFNILVADDSANRAETYISALRNSGMAVSSHHVANWEEFEDILDQSSPQIVLLNPDQFGDQNIITNIKRAKQLSPQPVIAVIEASLDKIQALYDAGCSEIVSPNSKPQLVKAVQNALLSVDLQQQVNDMKGQLEETENRCSALVESSRDAIAYVHEGMHVRANSVYMDMFGYTEFEELEIAPLMDLVTSGDQREFKDFLRKFERNQRGTSSLHVRARNLAEDEFDVTMEFATARVDGEPCTQIIIRDNSDSNSEELLERIESLSNKDLATELFNRHHFLREVDALCTANESRTDEIAIAYVALDNFDDIRAANGVDASDAIIKELGRIADSKLISNDLVARFNDSSITIMLRRAEFFEIENLMEDMRVAVQEHLFECSGKVSSLTCSIGLTSAPSDLSHSSASELATQAHRAAKEGQSNDGNQVIKFDPIRNAEQMAEGGESGLIESLRHALQHDRFELAFQPMVSLQGDAKERFACLLRLSDTEGQQIDHDAIYSSAASSGLNLEIDRWAIKKAVNTVVSLRKDGRRVVFFIKLSSATLASNDSLLWIMDCLREAKAKASWMVFQIHDSDLRKHLQPARKLLAGIKKVHGSIALDGFGSEPNAGKILKHLPIDFACVDASFTENLAGSEEHQEALGELNRLAQSFKVKTIARSVEDANSLAVLWTVGVDYIQSYFLQEPSEALNYDFGS